MIYDQPVHGRHYYEWKNEQNHIKENGKDSLQRRIRPDFTTFVASWLVDSKFDQKSIIEIDQQAIKYS